jgi:hypothetical protein
MANEDTATAYALVVILSALIGYCSFVLYVPLIGAFPTGAFGITIGLVATGAVAASSFFAMAYKSVLRHFN